MLVMSQTDFVEQILEYQTADLIFNFIRLYPEHKKKIKGLYSNYKLSLEDKCLVTDKCLARIFRNGAELQCSHPRKYDCFCTRHSKRLDYGKITEPIPDQYVDKFTKQVKNIKKIKKTNRNTQRISAGNKLMFLPSRLKQLERLELEYGMLFIDRATNYVYDIDNIYIGKFDNDEEIIYR